MRRYAYQRMVWICFGLYDFCLFLLLITALEFSQSARLALSVDDLPLKLWDKYDVKLLKICFLGCWMALVLL